MRRVILIATLLISLFLFTPPDLTIAFNFDFGGVSWESATNSASPDLSEGIHPSSSYGNKTGYIHTVDPIFSLSATYNIEVDMRSFNNFGSGIYLSKYIIGYPAPDMSDFGVGIWIDVEGAKFVSKFCLINTLCPQTIALYGTPSNIIGKHNITFTRNQSTVTVSDLTTGQVFDFIVPFSDPMYFVVGNPNQTQSSDFWSDYVVTKFINNSVSPTPTGSPSPTPSPTETPTPTPTPTPTSTPTPSPTPTPTPNTKIIVVPGMGASWNPNALFFGSSGGTWSLPSFVHLYDRLFSSLESSGLQRDKDYFVFAYDWRKSLLSLAGDFGDFLTGLRSSNKLSNSDELKIIGHSMGGLVARTYIQTYADPQITKLVTVGSPNLGSIDAYGLWEGGKIWSNLWWQQTLLGLNQVNNRLIGEREIDTLRRTIPVAKDLLPTWDYLRNPNVIPEKNLLQRNTTLTGLNSVAGLINSLTVAIAGDGVQTRSLVNVGKRDWRDSRKGLWEDGKPIQQNPFVWTAEGDNAVTVTSAGGVFSKVITIPGVDHGQLVNSQSGLETILGAVLNSPIVSGAPINETSERSWTVALHSPGRLHVCQNNSCDDSLGTFLIPQKLFTLSNYDGKRIDVEVVANGDVGDYELETMEITNGEIVSDNLTGTIAKNDLDRYQYSEDRGLSAASAESPEWFQAEVKNLIARLGGKWDGELLVRFLDKERSYEGRVKILRALKDLDLAGLTMAIRKNQNQKAEDWWSFLEALEKYTQSLLADKNSHCGEKSQEMKSLAKKLTETTRIVEKKGSMWGLRLLEKAEDLVKNPQVDEDLWLANRLLETIKLVN